MGDVNNLDAAVEVFEQNYPILGSLSWWNKKEVFVELFNVRKLGVALDLVKKLNIARPLACHAANDIFISWLRTDEKEKYSRAIEVFRDYGFGNWLKKYQEEVF
ncbi:MAG: hypothetical protein QXX68_02885 [Candidatus Pacearchaeota archaeon]